MSYSYAQAKNKNRKPADAESFAGGGEETSLPNSALLEVPGHQVDMPVVMREKMEDSFGMDLSAVKLYENQAVGKAGGPKPSHRAARSPSRRASWTFPASGDRRCWDMRSPTSPHRQKAR